MPLVAATGDIELKSVLIATDFSEASEKALRHALAIARHYGAKLYLAHVVSSLAYTLVGPDAVVAATDAVSRRVGSNSQARTSGTGSHRHTRSTRFGETTSRVSSGTHLSSRWLPRPDCRSGLPSGALERFGPFCSQQTSAKPPCTPCPTPSHPPITSKPKSFCSMSSLRSQCRRVFIGTPPTMSCE